MNGLSTFLAGLQSVAGPAGLPTLLIVVVAGMLIPLPLKRRTSTAFLLGLVLYVLVAGAETGSAWPALDRPTSALTTRIAWMSAAALLLAAWPRLGAWRVTLLFACCAALRPAVYGPHWLLSHAHASAPALLLYHLGGGVALAVVWMLVRAALARVGGAGLQRLAPFVFSAMALAVLSGVYGMLLREILARWPGSSWG